MGNKGLIITLIILLSVIIFGLTMFLVLVLNGNFSFSNGIMGFNSKSNNLIFDESYDIGEISNIEVLSNAGDVSFEESTDGNIRVVVYSKYQDMLKVNLNGNKLIIDNSRQKGKVFGFNNNIDDIRIYIPSSYAGKIDIENNYGTCRLCDLNDASIEVDADCGNVQVGSIKNADIKCNYGNVEVETILNNCFIKADCGNVKINRLMIKENSEIKCDLGDVKISEAKDIYIDARVDLGDIKMDGNNRHSDVCLKVEVDCGNIKVGL